MRSQSDRASLQPGLSHDINATKRDKLLVRWPRYIALCHFLLVITTNIHLFSHLSHVIVKYWLIFVFECDVPLFNALFLSYHVESKSYTCRPIDENYSLATFLSQTIWV